MPRSPANTNTRLYADQRRFRASLRGTDRRITCHLGRLETHMEKNEAARELREYLVTLPVRIDKRVCHDLLALVQRHELMLRRREGRGRDAGGGHGLSWPSATSTTRRISCQPAVT